MLEYPIPKDYNEKYSALKFCELLRYGFHFLNASLQLIAHRENSHQDFKITIVPAELKMTCIVFGICTSQQCQ